MAGGYLDNSPFVPSKIGPTEPKTPTTPVASDTLPEAWAWLLQTQADYVTGKKDSANNFISGEGYIVTQGGIPKLVFPSEETGKIGAKTVISEESFRQNIMANAMFDRAGTAKLQRELKAAGFLGSDFVANGTLDADGAFINAALLAARTTSAQNLAMATNSDVYGSTDPMTLTQYLKSAAKGVGGYGRTSVSTSVTSFSDAQSRSILESFYAEALGRRPTDEEVKKFKKSINIAAKANPDSTTTSYSPTGTSSSKSTSGYSQADAELTARNMAEKQVGASGYMSSTKYMGTFLQMLNGKFGV